MDQNTVSLTLTKAVPNDATRVLNWFRSDKQIKDWGGPAMYYPISVINFVDRLHFDEIATFKVIDKSSPNDILAFGQHYVRLGRHHLGRLVVSPKSRGQGVGRYLVEALIEKAHQSQDAKGESLFVMQDNQVAKSLYQSLGFTPSEYPEPLSIGFESCLYMIRN